MRARRASVRAVAAALTLLATAGLSAQTMAGDGRAAATPALPALLERVLARDPEVDVARGLYGIAQERLRQLQSRLLPVAALSAGQGRSQDVDLLRNLSRRTERAEVQLRWNIYNGGADAVEIDAARTELEAATLDLRRAREEVGERIALVYLELLRYERLALRASAHLQAVDGLVRQVSQQAEAGRIAAADNEQALALRADAELAHAAIVAERDAAHARLAAASGEAVVAVRPDGLHALLDRTAATAPAAAPEGPASLRAAQLRAQAARQRVRSREVLLAPRLDVEARHRLSDRTSPPLTSETRSSWSLNLRWEMPLGGETFARRNETERRAQATEADALRLAQAQQVERAGLPARIDNGERALRALDVQIERFGRLLQAAALQFEAGRRSLVQLIQLHESTFATEQRRAEQGHRLAADRLRRLALDGELLAALGQARDVPVPDPLPLGPRVGAAP